MFNVSDSDNKRFPVSFRQLLASLNVGVEFTVETLNINRELDMISKYNFRVK